MFIENKAEVPSRIVCNHSEALHNWLLIACSHRRHGQDKTARVVDVKRIVDKTRQFCLVSTQFPICNCSVSNSLYRGLLKIWRLETGSKQDKTVLSCLQLCRTTDMDKTRQSCLVRVGGVNKLQRAAMLSALLTTTSMSTCLSVCLSVRPSHAGIVNRMMLSSLASSPLTLVFLRI